MANMYVKDDDKTTLERLATKADMSTAELVDKMVSVLEQAEKVGADIDQDPTQVLGGMVDLLAVEYRARVEASKAALRGQLPVAG